LPKSSQRRTFSSASSSSHEVLTEAGSIVMAIGVHMLTAETATVKARFANLSQVPTPELDRASANTLRHVIQKIP